MGKKQKMIYIDEEIFDRLGKEDNASQLINNILNDYFNAEDTKELSLEQIDRREKELLARLEYAKKLEKIDKYGN